MSARHASVRAQQTRLFGQYSGWRELWLDLATFMVVRLTVAVAAIAAVAHTMPDLPLVFPTR